MPKPMSPASVYLDAFVRRPARRPAFADGFLALPTGFAALDAAAALAASPDNSHAAWSQW